MRNERRSIGTVLLAGAIALGAGGCSAISDFSDYMFGPPGVDGGVDSGVDAGVDSGVDGGPTPTGPTGIVQTSGSATVENGEHRLRISVGAPQPIGEASSSSERVIVGPEGL